jgi:tripartite-type tricarboxylate transporter receptor subunit TctC
MNRTITCLTVFMCAAASGFAFGQTYPTKAIRIIAPFAPGGGTDLIARVAAQKMTESLGQQVIVDNRPGAGGTVGATLAANAPPMAIPLR